MTVTIELPDEVVEKLIAQAQRQHQTLETFAAASLEKLARQENKDFEKIVDDILKDNAELYRRLA